MTCEHARLGLVRRYEGREVFPIQAIWYPPDDERDEQNPFDGASVTLGDRKEDEYTGVLQTKIFCWDCDLVLANNPEIEED